MEGQKSEVREHIVQIKKRAQERREKPPVKPKSVDEIIQERLSMLAPGKTFTDAQGSSWKIKDIVDRPENGETIKVFQVENSETGEEKAEWFRETDLREAIRAQVEKEQEEKKKARFTRPRRKRPERVKAFPSGQKEPKMVEEVVVRGVSRPGFSLRLEETGRTEEKPRPKRGGRENPPPKGPEVGRNEGQEPPEPPKFPSINEEGAPQDPVEYVEWKLDEYKLLFANHEITEFGSILEQTQVERAFRLDEIADAQLREELFHKIRAEFDFHSAFAYRVDHIDADGVKALKLAEHLDLRDRTRLYSKKGVGLATRLFNRYARELIDDANLSFVAQKYAKVETGNERDKYHNQENWDMIFDEIVAELQKPSDQGGAGLDERTARARTKLAQELFKMDNKFADFGKSLVVEEEEEKFYGGGFEYQMRREMANIPWAKREGVPGTDILQEVLDELKERHSSFRLTNNLSGWGTFYHSYPELRLKDDSVSEALEGLSDDDKKDEEKVKARLKEVFKLPDTIKVQRVVRRIGDQKRLDKWWEINVEDALLDETRRGTLEDLPYEHIDWGALERGERGTIGAWISDGLDAASLRNELFDTEKGVAWHLHDKGLAHAREQITDAKMGAHFTTDSGKGERYDFQGTLLAKISEKECRPWIRPRDYHGYSEFVSRRVEPAVHSGLFEHDVFMVYNASVGEIRAGTGIDETWVAQRLLAFHDEDTLRAYFETNDPGFTNWVRRAALGDVQTRNAQEQIWQGRLNATVPQDIRAFHMNLIMDPQRARVNWDERYPGYELQGEYISRIDNLTIRDEWKLSFIDPKDFQDVRDGKKTVNRALAEGLISTRDQMRLKGAEAGFEEVLLDTLTKKKVVTDNEANAIAQVTDSNEWNNKVNELLNKRTDEIFKAKGKENMVGRHLVDEDRLLATLTGSYNAGFSKKDIRARASAARARGESPYKPAGNRVDIRLMTVGDPYETWERKIIHEDPTNPAHEKVELQPTAEDLKEMTLLQEPLFGPERTRKMLERLGYKERNFGPFRFSFSAWDAKNAIVSGGPTGDFDRALEERIAKIAGKVPPKFMPFPKLNAPDLIWTYGIAFGFLGVGLFSGLTAYEVWYVLSVASRFGLSPTGAYRWAVRSKIINPRENPIESDYKKKPQRMVDLIKAS